MYGELLIYLMRSQSDLDLKPYSAAYGKKACKHNGVPKYINISTYFLERGSIFAIGRGLPDLPRRKNLLLIAIFYLTNFVETKTSMTKTKVPCDVTMLTEFNDKSHNIRK